MNGDISMNGDLNITGDISINGDISMNGDLNITGDVSMNAPTKILMSIADADVLNIRSAGLRVGDGNAPTEALDVSGNIKASGTITTIGDATIGGNTTIEGNAIIEGTFEIEGTRIDFNNADFISASAGGNSGQHLRIYINGTEYKIKLENP
jgi:cytoskeletal protein CcmA (bactofilin family)